MKAADVRDRVVKGLHQYLEMPVILSDQISPESEMPYIVYSVTSPYIPGGTLGHYGNKIDVNGNLIQIRSEQAGMTMSFTACSQNRTEKDGSSIFGEDEAMSIAERAQGWFLHAGRGFLSPDVVVESVENVARRSVLMVDEEANRYGFDVLLRYIREDVMNAGSIKTVTSKGREI